MSERDFDEQLSTVHYCCSGPPESPLHAHTPLVRQAFPLPCALCPRAAAFSIAFRCHRYSAGKRVPPTHPHSLHHTRPPTSISPRAFRQRKGCRVRPLELPQLHLKRRAKAISREIVWTRTNGPGRRDQARVSPLVPALQAGGNQNSNSTTSTHSTYIQTTRAVGAHSQP